MVATKPWERGLPIAAEHVRQLARGAAAEIEIVGSVFDAAVSAGRDRGEAAARKSHDRTVAAARAGLERLAAPLRAWGARVTTRIVWGVPPYEAILASAQDWQAELLVVGTHERGTLHTRLTDTDWQLLRRACCPLLLVKGAEFDGYRTIVAAADPLRADEPDGVDRTVLAASRWVADTCGSAVQAVGVSPAETILYAAAQCRADLVIVGGAANTAELIVGALRCDVLIVPVADEPSAVRSKVG